MTYEVVVALATSEQSENLCVTKHQGGNCGAITIYVKNIPGLSLKCSHQNMAECRPSELVYVVAKLTYKRWT